MIISHLIPAISEGDRVSLVYGDLKDTLSVGNAVASSKPDYILPYLAAQSYPKTSFDAPLDTLSTNIQGTLRLLEAAKQHAPMARYIYAHLQKYLAELQKTNFQLMKTVLFIRRLLTLYPKLVQILSVDIMLKHLICVL